MEDKDENKIPEAAMKYTLNSILSQKKKNEHLVNQLVNHYVIGLKKKIG